MPLSATIPTLGSKKSVKKQIISVLSNEWPLTAKKTYSRMREQGLDVSYQAVFKSLKELVQRGILVKINRKYKISLKWIKDMHNYIKEMEARYTGNETPFCGRIFDSKNINLFVFDSVFDLDHFNLYLLKNRKDPVAYTQSHHFWWSLFHFQEEKKPQIPRTDKIYSICAGKTFVDRIAVELEKSMKFNVRQGVEFRHNHDVFVVDDKVVFMFYPKEFLQKIRTLYSEKRNVLDKKFFDEFNNIFSKRRRIFVCLIKNKELANHIRDVISDAFR